MPARLASSDLRHSERAKRERKLPRPGTEHPTVWKSGFTEVAKLLSHNVHDSDTGERAIGRSLNSFTATSQLSLNQANSRQTRKGIMTPLVP